MMQLPEDDESTFELFVDLGKPGLGPGTGPIAYGYDQAGVEDRLKNYVGVDIGTRKADGRSHEKMLARSHKHMNLCIIADSKQGKTPKLYVMLMELLSSILLQRFSLQSAERNLRGSKIEMTQKARPRDLPKVRHNSFDTNAAQCHQGLFFRPSKATVYKKCLISRKNFKIIPLARREDIEIMQYSDSSTSYLP
ncbi:hypothetical protein IMSHALPRED_000876 [Imshaugia aleurites]|uniref:Uncharacterized protein n=1 Tax=Imshaugia aleurites TaxID=172621 RepID=A0A8H3IEJ4_9LECA|nr:hypothetical protein IMSHALPRED_000876 [Imshaugia aleurites]